MRRGLNAALRIGLVVVAVALLLAWADRSARAARAVGGGIFLIDGDTLSLASGPLDTITVIGPRVTVGEVVRRVGERMAADQERLGDHAWTQVTRLVERPSTGPGGEADRKEHELVERMRLGADGSLQTVRLHRVERRYKRGVLDQQKVDDEIEDDWDDLAQAAGAIPFSLESGDAYNYEIVSREIVGGERVIYEIRHFPRSRFHALPTGTVWIDCSDFVIQSMEGSFQGAVPAPLFLKGIPWYRVRRVPCGGTWVVSEMMARVELRDVLPGLPASIELYIETREHQIGGVDCGYAPPPAAAVGPAAAVSPHDAPDPWERLDARWRGSLTPSLLQPVLAAAAVDSLSMVGDRRLSALLMGRHWRMTWAPLARLDFNRCEGLRPGLALRGRRLVRHGARFEVGVGYGIARERAVGDARLDVPLGIARPEDGDDTAALSWERLRLTLHAADEVAPFAGSREFAGPLDAALSGVDPAMYLARRAAGAALSLRPARELELRAGARVERHRALPVATRWTLSGSREDVPENWPAEGFTARMEVLGAGGRWGALRWEFEAQWAHLNGAAAAGSPKPPRQVLRVSGLTHADWLTRGGHELALRARWWRNDRAAPLQWKHWLGGAGSLRGYPVRELAGDHAAVASVDLRGGFDALRTLRLPLLGRLGLQPIAFADWGWAERGDVTRVPAGAIGWRVDAGVGLGKQLGVGGEEANLRLYAAHPVGNGQADREWQVLLLLEP